MKKYKIFNCEICGNKVSFDYDTTYAHNIGRCKNCKEEFSFDDDEELFFATIQKDITDYELKIECEFCKKEFGVVELLNSICPYCSEKYIWCADEERAYSPIIGVEFINGTWHQTKFANSR